MYVIDARMTYKFKLDTCNWTTHVIWVYCSSVVEWLTSVQKVVGSTPVERTQNFFFQGIHVTDWIISFLNCFLSQEDFVKWKGALFYRFITTLVDEDLEIRKFGLLPYLMHCYFMF